MNGLICKIMQNDDLQGYLELCKFANSFDEPLLTEQVFKSKAPKLGKSLGKASRWASFT